MIVSDPARTRVALTRLHALGVRISIDDFGIGYTSLGHLGQLELDQIKVDRSFVTDMATDEGKAAIVRSIVKLGHDLGLEVVAEGVETEVAWDSLERLGCDTIQGYYVSRPLDAEALTELLSQSAVTATEAA
jgi:EAL domain-containing protein (putative c-di-GMP-specific phosphodiesterase class I)